MAVNSTGSHGQPNFDNAFGFDYAVDLNAIANFFATAGWTNWVPNVGNMTNGGSHQWRWASGKVQMRGYFASPDPTGEPGMSFPVNADNTYNAPLFGQAMLYHAGLWYPAFAVATSATGFVFKAMQVVAAPAPVVQDLISHTSPFTWVSGDSIQYELEYTPA